MTPNNLQDLYLYQLRDLYDAETQLLDDFPDLVEEATSLELQRAFRAHLEEKRQQKKRLEEIFQRMEESPDGLSSKGMKGLIKEAKDLVDETSNMFSEDAPPEIVDAGLISATQRVVHYEIASYGTVATYASMLGRADDQNVLKRSLDEVKILDETLTRIATQSVNPVAGRA